MQRDCVNADQQESVKRLKKENGELSVLVEELKTKIAQLNEEMDFMS